MDMDGMSATHRLLPVNWTNNITVPESLANIICLSQDVAVVEEVERVGHDTRRERLAIVMMNTRDVEEDDVIDCVIDTIFDSHDEDN
jgi:hypothetical protein